jgi:4-amino-4-deoxy-L-arabinose transferase-like glycosyltransferase
VSRLRAFLSTPRGVLAALALILVVGGALRAQQAIHGSGYQSADERSYAKLAIDLATHHHYGDASTHMSEPLHWPPGAPLLFALAYKIHPSAHGSLKIQSVLWAQWVVGMALILVVFLLARMLAGDAAGLISATVIALYPPAIINTSEQLSEPLGALVLALGVLALAWAVREGRWWRWGLSGLALGAAVLVRADLLVAPFLVALVVAVVLGRRLGNWRPGFAAGGLLAAGALLILAPWTIYASARKHQLVPVTTGGGSALFVGTYLPGDGNTFNMKRELVAETRRREPQTRTIKNPLAIPAADVLDAVAKRNPRLSHDASLRKEGLANIKRYVLHDPLGWAGLMVRKLDRMWTRYARGGAMHTSWEIRVLHILIVIASFAGLLYGLWRTRSLVLGAILAIIAWSTALHMLVVAQGRYNLPLMPILVVGGVAGWLLARRGTAIIAPWPPRDLPPSRVAPPGPETSPHPSATS